MKRVIDIPDGEYDFIKFLGANYTNYQTTELLYRAVRSSKTYEERPRGEWIYDKSIPNWVCSECGAVPSDWGGTTNSKYTVTKINRFCRSCGADMRGNKT